MREGRSASWSVEHAERLCAVLGLGPSALPRAAACPRCPPPGPGQWNGVRTMLHLPDQVQLRFTLGNELGASPTDPQRSFGLWAKGFAGSLQVPVSRVVRLVARAGAVLGAPPTYAFGDLGVRLPLGKSRPGRLFLTGTAGVVFSPAGAGPALGAALDWRM